MLKEWQKQNLFGEQLIEISKIILFTIYIYYNIQYICVNVIITVNDNACALKEVHPKQKPKKLKNSIDHYVNSSKK